MTMWLAFASLLLVALGFVVLPLYRNSRRLTPLLTGAIVVMVGLSAGLYSQIGNPGVESGAAAQPDAQQMVDSLAARLQRDPTDVEGWLMLARSYEVLEQYPKAADAYEKVLELQPNHPTALFYGGYIAAGRGETNLAADRWEAILRFGAAPEDVRASMQKQIETWRGEPGPQEMNAVTREQPQVVVEANISLSETAAGSLPAEAVVFLIARDPAQPSPPIAVARRQLAELPLSVSLSDRDSMVPGRNLSAYPEFELIARVSVSGQPMAQSGDWFGSMTVVSGGAPSVDLVIGQMVE